MSNTSVVFPGQGSQSVGMLTTLAMEYPHIIHTFNEASAIIDFDLWGLCQYGPAELLDQTYYTQPAMLAAGVAVWRLLHEKKPLQPRYLAGHSLGEFTALVCAQALSYTDAIQLVSARGRFMQEAVTPGKGTMAAIVGLTDDQVKDLCQSAAHNEVVSPANFNSIGQVVVAGHTEAVKRLMDLAKNAGAKLVKQLPVSVPSHCALMKPAAEEFAKLLENIAIKSPTIPVVNNVDVAVRTHPDDIRNALTRQLYNPVRWVETIQFLQAHHIEKIIECGPGKVLTSLNKRIDKTLNCINISEPTDFEILEE